MVVLNELADCPARAKAHECLQRRKVFGEELIDRGGSIVGRGHGRHGFYRFPTRSMQLTQPRFWESAAALAAPRGGGLDDVPTAAYATLPPRSVPSLGRASVVPQDAAKALFAPDLGSGCRPTARSLDDLVAEPLVRAFEMVVLNELPNRPVK